MDDVSRKRLRDAVLMSGRSMKANSRAAGMGETFLRDVLDRHTDPSVSKLARIAAVLGTTVGAIMNDSKTTVPIVGYVESGGSMYFVTEDFDSAELDQAPAPPGASLGVVATELRSDSAIGIAEKGWLLYFDSTSQDPTQDCIGKLCVCWLDDETIVMRKIYAGSDDRHWNLFQLSSQTMIENARVLRAAPVIWMRPR